MKTKLEIMKIKDLEALEISLEKTRERNYFLRDINWVFFWSNSLSSIIFHPFNKPNPNCIAVINRERELSMI